MLALNRLASLALHLVIPAALLTGCVVKKVDSDSDIDDSTTVSSGSGNTGSGGAGGGTGGSGGQGGAGGGSDVCSPSYPTCVGETAQCAYTADSCAKLNIAPEQGATQCGEDPIGYRLCNRSFTQFNQGAAEYLYGCLETIGVQNACDVEPVQTCMNELWTDTCASAMVTDFCTTSLSGCIEQATCEDNLKVFSGDGLDALVTCINDEADPQLSCADAYDFCYTKAMTF